MKKLLVTAIGAAAALGASAGLISTQRFETASLGATNISGLNEVAGGTYWSGDELTNKYEIVSAVGEAFPQDTPLGSVTKALSVKTTFGMPLSVSAIDGGTTSTNIPASGIYFDSLVKFTVCEDAPDQAYDNAKIVMWLQEQYDANEEITGTNIMVRASYIDANGTFTPTNFTCYSFDSDIDAWHRVTIKTWASILNNEGVPGFAIFIDNELVNTVSAEGTMASEIAANLTEAAGHFGKKKVFASLVQGNAAGKSSITSASFDGTGKLTDIVFTDEAPFAAAEDYVEPQAEVQINGTTVLGIKTLAQAVAAVNNATAGQTAELTLKKGMTLDGTLVGPLVFASPANVILDFAGFVITNSVASVAAITANGAGKLIITNSTVAVGGVRSVDAAAIAQGEEAGVIDIYGGNFWGAVTSESIDDASIQLYGGSFSQNTYTTWLAPGKVFSAQSATYPGLYDVIDAPTTYTVRFFDDVEGSGQMIGEAQSVESGALAVAPAAPTKTGYTFVDWTPSTNVAISANTDFYPTWTANNYNITYYYGESALDLAPATYTFGTGATLPASAGTKAGYDFAGWYDNAQFTGDAVTAVAANETGNKAFYAKYTATTYTITFVAEGGTVDPASTNYTIESGAITLPSAVHNGGLGQLFDGWTNATMTITKADLTFTPTAANLGDFTLYAKWTAGGETYPSYIDTSDSTVKKQYDDWKALYGDDSGSSHEAAFLLNVAMDGDTTLDATAVTISGSTVTITLDHNNINGYPYYKAASTVAGLASATKVAITTERSGAVITLTGQSGDAKFYQIGISSKSDLSDD